MLEPGWIDFYTAAVDVARLRQSSVAEAQASLREACLAESIRSMKAPYDEGQLPFEFWTRVAHHEWRERNVDYDGPDSDGCKVVVMLNEDDFRHWLRPKSLTLKRISRKRISAADAIAAIWPDGIPEGVTNPELDRRVNIWLKDNRLAELSLDTILRAADRKK